MNAFDRSFQCPSKVISVHAISDQITSDKVSTNYSLTSVLSINLSIYNVHCALSRIQNPTIQPSNHNLRFQDYIFRAVMFWYKCLSKCLQVTQIIIRWKICNVPNIVSPVFLVYNVHEAAIANYLLLANSKRPFMFFLHHRSRPLQMRERRPREGTIGFGRLHIKNLKIKKFLKKI